MIYDLTTAIEAFLRLHNDPPISLRDEMLARKKKLQEQEQEEVSRNSNCNNSNNAAVTTTAGAFRHLLNSIKRKED